MKVYSKPARDATRDVVVINHEHVCHNLSNIVDLLKNYLEKENFCGLNSEQIKQFWQDVSQKLAICLLDYQHCR